MLCAENKLFHEDIILDEEDEQEVDQKSDTEDYSKKCLDGLIGVNVTLYNG